MWANEPEMAEKWEDEEEKNEQNTLAGGGVQGYTGTLSGTEADLRRQKKVSAPYK